MLTPFVRISLRLGSSVVLDTSESLSWAASLSSERTGAANTENEQSFGRRDEIGVRFDPGVEFPACDFLVQFPVKLPSVMPRQSA